MGKIKKYTTKEHKVYYLIKDNRWEELTETSLRPLLKNYKNEQINIVTEPDKEKEKVEDISHMELSKE